MITKLRQIFKDLVLDERFAEILTGSVWALAAQLVATGFGLLTSIIIARMYGAEMMGILAVIRTFLMFAVTVAALGTNTSILRLIPEHVAKYSLASAFNLYRKTLYFIGGASLLIGVMLFFAAELIATRIFAKPHLSFYFALAAGFVVFRSLMNLNTHAVRGLRLLRTFAFVQVLPSAGMLLALVVMTFLDGGLNSPVYAQMAAWGFTAIISGWIVDYYFRKRMRPDDRVQSMPLRDILSISSPMMITTSMQFVIGQSGVILLGVFRTEAEIGYYSMAVTLSTLTSFVLGAINSMAAPKFSELYHKGKVDELIYVARKSTRLIFYTTLPILLLLLTAGGPILGAFFGPEFTVAYPALTLLVLGQFVNSISGSTGIFMNMTGHQKVLRNVMIVVALLNIVLSLVLIPRFGVTGAACAATLCLMTWNVYCLLYIRRRFGKSIGYVPFLVGMNGGSNVPRQP